MSKNGIVTSHCKEKGVYHNVIALFKIYRSVSWRMQVQIKQVSHQFRREYGTDVEEFLDSIYQAGMDINDDSANIRTRVEAINSSHQFLQLIDESVELMRKYHPQGERNYWVLYYTYMCPYKPNNVSEIIAKVESHLPQQMQINRCTYFRWREQALKTIDSILWGYEEESRKLLVHYRDTWAEQE